MWETELPRFRLLPKVNSLGLAGNRYFPGDEVELTDEQAKRLNLDIFVNIEPEPLPPLSPGPVKDPESSSKAAPVEEAPAVLAQMPKKPKRAGFAGKVKL